MTRREKEEVALWRAAKSCNAKKLQQLVRKESVDDVQALLDQPHPVKGTTPLMVAATKNHGGETVRALIQLGADLDATDRGKHRNTALHYAAYNNRIGQLELLLDAGANPFTLNGKGTRRWMWRGFVDGRRRLQRWPPDCKCTVAGCTCAPSRCWGSGSDAGVCCCRATPSARRRSFASSAGQIRRTRRRSFGRTAWLIPHTARRSRMVRRTGSDWTRR